VLTDFQPAEVLRLIESERVTIANLVPTMAAMLLAEATLKTRDLSSLRGLVFAGAMFPEPLRLRVAAELCSNVYEYYGMQETGTLTVSTPEDRKLYPESVGAPLAFAEVHIERPDGSVAPAGEIGEIVGRSPATCTAYFDNPAKTAETFRGGFVHTGDLGMMNEDGFPFHQGPAEGHDRHRRTERPLRRGRGDPNDGARRRRLRSVRASGRTVGASRSRRSSSHPRGAEHPTVDGLTVYCRERLAGFKIPRSIHLQSDPLPRTPTGKVQKFLLVERFRPRATGAPNTLGLTAN